MFKLCMTSFWNSRVTQLLREKISLKVCSNMFQTCLNVFVTGTNMFCNWCQVPRLMAVQSWKCCTKTHIRCCWRHFKRKRPKERCTGNHKTWGILHLFFENRLKHAETCFKYVWNTLVITNVVYRVKKVVIVDGQPTVKEVRAFNSFVSGEMWCKMWSWVIISCNTECVSL